MTSSITQTSSANDIFRRFDTDFGMKPNLDEQILKDYAVKDEARFGWLKAHLETKNSTGQTLLHRVSSSYALAVTHYLLLTCKMNPCSQDLEGNSPFHLICSLTNKVMLDAFLADLDPSTKSTLVSLKNAEGNTPLLCAAKDEYFCRKLLEAGAKISDQNHEGNNAFHVAALASSEASLSCLLDHVMSNKTTAELNAANKQGFTPLHYIAMHLPVLYKKAVKAGANPEIPIKKPVNADAESESPSMEGKTPLDLLPESEKLNLQKSQSSSGHDSPISRHWSKVITNKSDKDLGTLSGSQKLSSSTSALKKTNSMSSSSNSATTPDSELVKDVGILIKQKAVADEQILKLQALIHQFREECERLKGLEFDKATAEQNVLRLEQEVEQLKAKAEQLPGLVQQQASAEEKAVEANRQLVQLRGDVARLKGLETAQASAEQDVLKLKKEVVLLKAQADQLPALEREKINAEQRATEANKQMDQLRADVARLKALETAQASAEQHARSLEQKVEQLKTKADQLPELERQKASAEQKITVAKQQIDQLQVEVSRLKGLEADKASAEKRLLDLKRETEQWKAKAEQLPELERQLASGKKIAADAKQQIDQLQGEVARLGKIEQELAQTKKQMGPFQEAASELEQSKREGQQAVQRAVSAEQQAQEQQTEIARLEALLKSEKAEAMRAASASAYLTTQLESANATLSKLSEEKEEAVDKADALSLQLGLLKAKMENSPTKNANSSNGADTAVRTTSNTENLTASNSSVAAPANDRQNKIKLRALQACKNGQKDDEEWLRGYLKTGEDPQAADQSKRTLLHIAAAHHRNNMVALLLEYHADVRLRDAEGKLPIDLVDDSKSTDAQLKEMLRNFLIHSSFHRALLAGKNQDAQRFFFEENLNLDCLDLSGNDPKTGNTVLHEAVLLLDNTLVSLILEKNRNIVDTPNTKGYTPLMLVCQKEESPVTINIARNLVEWGANPEGINPNLDANQARGSINMARAKKSSSRSKSGSSSDSSSVTGLMEILTSPQHRPWSHKREVECIINHANWVYSKEWLCLHDSSNAPKYKEAFQRFGKIFDFLNPFIKENSSANDASAIQTWKADLEYWKSQIISGGSIGVPGLKHHQNAFCVAVTNRIETLIKGHLDVIERIRTEAKKEFPKAAVEAFFKSIEEGQLHRLLFWLSSDDYPNLRLDRLHIDFNGDTLNPLHYAAVKGKAVVFNELLKQSPIDLFDQTTKRGKPLSALVLDKPLLIFALDYNNAQRDRPLELEKHYKTLDESHNNALHLAFDKGCHELLPFILERFPDGLNQQNQAGQYPADVLKQAIEETKNDNEGRLARCQEILTKHLNPLSSRSTSTNAIQYKPHADRK